MDTIELTPAKKTGKVWDCKITVHKNFKLGNMGNKHKGMMLTPGTYTSKKLMLAQWKKKNGKKVIPAYSIAVNGGKETKEVVIKIGSLVGKQGRKFFAIES